MNAIDSSISGTHLKIEGIYDELNATERKIATYLLQNGDDVFRMTISEIAARCETSEAALVRFCKRLGFVGWKELKRAFADDILGQKRENDAAGSYSDVAGEYTPENIWERVCKNNMRAISETRLIIDVKKLCQAIDILSEAPRIDFYGSGASGLVALDAQQKFMRIGRTCNANADSHVQMVLAANLRAGDAAVLISNSGMTQDTVDVLRVARAAGAVTIAITKFGANLLTQEAALVLNTSSPEALIRSGAMSSRIAQLTVIDALFTGVASANLETYKASLDQSYRYTLTKRYPCD